MTIWMFEDNPGTIQDFIVWLKDNGIKGSFEVRKTFREALAVVPSVKNDDVVLLDSQLPFQDAGLEFREAGLRLALESRSSGHQPLLVWSTAAPLPEILGPLGVVALNPRTLLNLLKTGSIATVKPKLPADFAAQATRLLEARFPPENLLAPFLVPFTLCQGYLAVCAAHEFDREDLAKQNPLIDCVSDISYEIATNLRQHARELATLKAIAPGEDKIPSWFKPAADAMAFFRFASGRSVSDIAYWDQLLRPPAGFEDRLSHAPERLTRYKHFLAPQHSQAKELYLHAVDALAKLSAALLPSSTLLADLKNRIPGYSSVDFDGSSKNVWFDLIRRAHVGYQILALVHL
jgi:hypothetical protein